MSSNRTRPLYETISNDAWTSLIVTEAHRVKAGQMLYCPTGTAAQVAKVINQSRHDVLAVPYADSKTVEIKTAQAISIC